MYMDPKPANLTMKSLTPSLYMTMDAEATESIDRRGATRHDLKLNVTVEGASGVTENVSSSGILLVGHVDAQAGDRITLEMNLPAMLGGGGGHVLFEAEVVRVEDRPEGQAIAAHFTDWRVIDAS